MTEDGDVRNERLTLPLSEKDQLSVNILKAVQEAANFRQAGNDVVLYSRNEEGELIPLQEKYSVEDFLDAVDYYCKNRDLELKINMEMTKENGEVDVFAPLEEGRKERPVVVRIKNYKVPQILEFAYLSTRQSQTK